MQMPDYDPETIKLIEKLREKVESAGESFSDHLEGLLETDFMNYWDYVGIDALLNLQKPRTKYPDEMIFIVYHQMTELYFKIIMHELEQIGFEKDITRDFFVKKINRINLYLSHLTQSFQVLVSGMDHDQFMTFRKALTPASGFQSIQYRLIELWATEFINLVREGYQDQFDKNSRIEDMYDYIYWKQGATDPKTGKKTLTLRQFEEKYSKLIVRKGKEFRDKNILYRYKNLSKNIRNDEELIEALRLFDYQYNIDWPLAHYRYALKYLQKGDNVLKSTGGTNWKQYLPPRFQRMVFFPQLWSAEEMENWGKHWVEKELSENSV